MNYKYIMNFQAYGTEQGVGAAVAKLIENGVDSNGRKITRQDLFLESKVLYFKTALCIGEITLSFSTL